MITRAQPPSAQRSETLHRLEPIGSSASWGVQVGAFSNPDNARQHASHAAGRLSQELFNARVNIDEVNGSQTFFRARLVNLDENQAYRACRSLAREGMDCMVVNF
ncbi:MAG: SPOR domain-containing protein [Halomonas sp.]|nr:SPOR domain-containing protein [Halomonas sp.]